MSDLYLMELIATELGLTDEEALKKAAALRDKIQGLELTRLAQQVVGDQAATRAQRLEEAHVVTAAEFLTESEEPAAPLLGDLMAEGHNASITAQYKTGKTELILNAAAALVYGGRFLSRFDVAGAYRVALLNYELTEADQRERLRAFGLGAEALERLLVLNLRGVGLSMTTPAGADWLVGQLLAHRAEVVIVDTYGAASAPSVDSENDNAAARRFLMAFDQIKARARVHSSIWTAHTGRKEHEEGAEHSRGATTFDDWVDVRMVLTKDRETRVRHLSSEGRSRYNLPESSLCYDASSRALWIPEGGEGQSRALTRQRAGGEKVLAIVGARPGLNASELRAELRKAGVTSHDDQERLLKAAEGEGRLAPVKVGREKKFYLGHFGNGHEEAIGT
jgi:hypothetical protein